MADMAGLPAGYTRVKCTCCQNELTCQLDTFGTENTPLCEECWWDGRHENLDTWIEQPDQPILIETQNDK